MSIMTDLPSNMDNLKVVRSGIKTTLLVNLAFEVLHLIGKVK